MTALVRFRHHPARYRETRILEKGSRRGAIRQCIASWGWARRDSESCGATERGMAGQGESSPGSARLDKTRAQVGGEVGRRIAERGPVS